MSDLHWESSPDTRLGSCRARNAACEHVPHVVRLCWVGSQVLKCGPSLGVFSFDFVWAPGWAWWLFIHPDGYPRRLNAYV